MRNDQKALMFPYGGERALADGLARLLDDAAVRARLTAAGHGCVARYSRPAIADEVLRVYP